VGRRPAHPPGRGRVLAKQCACEQGDRGRPATVRKQQIGAFGRSSAVT
jgi:hypothetical protein